MASEAVEEGSEKGGGVGVDGRDVPSPLEVLGVAQVGVARVGVAQMDVVQVGVAGVARVGVAQMDVVQVGVAGGDRACVEVGEPGESDEESSCVVVEWEQGLV